MSSMALQQHVQAKRPPVDVVNGLPAPLYQLPASLQQTLTNHLDFWSRSQIKKEVWIISRWKLIFFYIIQANSLHYCKKWPHIFLLDWIPEKSHRMNRSKYAHIKIEKRITSRSRIVFVMLMTCHKIESISWWQIQFPGAVINWFNFCQGKYFLIPSLHSLPAANRRNNRRYWC